MFCRAGLISTAVASFAQGQRVGVRPERNNHSPVPPPTLQNCKDINSLDW